MWKVLTSELQLVQHWNGRGERIRTSGLYVPNVALYQAKLHPELTERAIAHVNCHAQSR